MATIEQICINDNERISGMMFMELKPLVQHMFEDKYPEKCKYEL